MKHVVSAAVAAGMVYASAASAATMAGNSSAFDPGNSWAWDGPSVAAFRAAIGDSANFGPGGVAATETVTTVDLPDLTPASLAGVDIFFVGYWSDFYGTPFATDLVNWFLGGGNLIVMADKDTHDPINAALGLASINGTANPTTVSGVLANGSFGVPGTIDQEADTAHFDNAAITAQGGSIDGLDAAGQATLATFDDGAFGPGSGRLVLFADVDFISSEFSDPADFAALDAGARLGLNAIEYLLEPVSPVPLPAGLPLMLAGMGGLALMRRRR